MQSVSLGMLKCGLYMQVVFIYSWSGLSVAYNSKMGGGRTKRTESWDSRVLVTYIVYLWLKFVVFKALNHLLRLSQNDLYLKNGWF